MLDVRGKPQSKRVPSAALAFHTDFPTMVAHDAFGDREPESTSDVDATGGGKARFEDRLVVLGGDSRSVVADGDITVVR